MCTSVYLDWIYSNFFYNAFTSQLEIGGEIQKRYFLF